MTTIVRSVQS